MSKKQQSRRAKTAHVARTEPTPEARTDDVRQDASPDVATAAPVASADLAHVESDREQEANPGVAAVTQAQQPAVRETSPSPPIRHRGPQVTATQADIRGVLIQLAGARLLLPNATIAEVLSYAPPEPVEAAPEWLLGKIRWRGWQLPLVAFAELAGVGKEPAGLGSKVVVLKALGGNAKAPYFAILSQGFPRLVTVSQEGLVPDLDSAALPLGVQCRVIMNEDTAFVPDLGVVESLITDALAQAA